MLVPMTKVEIVGHRRCLDATLALLQQRGAIQLLDASSVAGLAVSSLAVDEGYVREAEQLRHLGLRLDGLLDLVELPPPPPEAEAFTEADLDSLWAELEELAPELDTLVERLDAFEAERAVLPRHVESLRRLLPLVPELPELQAYETVALLVDRRHAAVVDLVRSELAAMLDTRFEVISGQVDRDTVGAVLVIPRRESRRVHALLSQEQVSRVHLPEQFRDLPLASAIVAMERRIAALPAEVAAGHGALQDLLGPRADWHLARSYLEHRLGQIDALRLVGSTARAFVIVGWVPTPELDGMAAGLRDEVGPEVLLAQLDPDPDDETPVLLANPGPARPFQLFVRMLALPKYGTIDPTVLMALFLPLFFGIMLGDIAYGSILLGLSVWVWRRWGRRSDVVADLTRILGMGAAWAVVWGVVFGEAFGDLGRRLVDLEPIWINREEAIEPLLIFAIAIGAAHIVLGLVLGLWVAARIGDRQRLAERAALLAALIGLFAITGVVTELLPSGVITPAVAAVIVSFVTLVAVQWPLGVILGPLDLLGVVTNVLSYLRIAALGLASVFLARVANELGATAPLLIGIVVATLFHVLNLALGAFSPTIQALRLHYVEFFDKFYEPGGGPFEPFGAPAVPVRAAQQVPAAVGT
jgi:V/A-type H+-transporting ATPase subunit I